ncbi:hypothetical protein GW17_00037664 [Ensete ventricosum]|nr:hypothetical protein GW17_00037664 [Ensete ventricosum]
MGAAPTGVVALASDSPGRGAAPCDLATGSRPLWPGRGRCLRQQASPQQAPAMPRATVHAGDCPCKGLWPWPAAPLQEALATACLAVGGRPSSSLCENAAIMRRMILHDSVSAQKPWL